MPKIPINFLNTVIYKIVCKDIDINEFYIGSTTNFTKRKGQHRGCVKNDIPKNNYKVYRFIRDNGDWENWDMILVESYACDNKLEQERRERYWIELLKPQLNKCIPTRTNKEYRDDNKTSINIQRKQYRDDNKDKIKERKSYRVPCHFCNHDISLDHKTRHENTLKHKANYCIAYDKLLALSKQL